MKVENDNVLKVKLKGDDAVNFKSAIKKIVEEESKAGFKTGRLTEEESKVIKNISDKC
jgi:hypothetical protein